MVVEATSIKGVLTEFLTPILMNIGGGPTREGLIDIDQLISGNAASVSSKLRGGRHVQLALKITRKEYASQTGFMFFQPHNLGNYLSDMGNAQDQALGNEKFRKNQTLFWKYTPADTSLKN